MDDRLITEAEAAEYLGVARGTLKQWRWLHTGPPWVRIGRRAIRYRMRDLDDYIAAGRHDPEDAVIWEKRLRLRPRMDPVGDLAPPPADDPLAGWDELSRMIEERLEYARRLIAEQQRLAGKDGRP